MSRAPEPARGNPVLQIGAKAHAALRRSDGRTVQLPSFRETGYRLAGDDIIWLGSPRRPMHPRAVLVGDPALAVDRLGSWSGPAWQPNAVSARTDASTVQTRCQFLKANIGRVGQPQGFGVLLAGGCLSFPLDLAEPYVRAVAAGIAEGDADRMREAAMPLLGLGLGLTPSGDDFVGAALFGLHVRSHDEAAWQHWNAAARTLVLEVRRRSNIISAALFADLAEGQSFAPLHSLAEALLTPGSGADTVTPAREVVAIGHSSGWDMLTGLVVGLTGVLSDSDVTIAGR